MAKPSDEWVNLRENDGIRTFVPTMTGPGKLAVSGVLPANTALSTDSEEVQLDNGEMVEGDAHPVIPVRSNLRIDDM